MNEEYLRSLYGTMASIDPTYKDDVSFEDFVVGMSDNKYAATIYETLNQIDPTYKDDVTIVDFLESVRSKKKDSTESPSEDGPLEQPKAEVPEISKGFDLAEEVKQSQEVEGKEMREDDYVNPLEGLGMYPDEDVVSRAYEQSFADLNTTKANMEAEMPAIKIRQQEEREAKAEMEMQLDQERAELLEDPEFKNLLQVINPTTIMEEEEQVVPMMNSLYGKYGFFFRQIGLGDAMEVVGPDGQTLQIDLDPFLKSTASEEAVNLKNFIKSNAIKKSEFSERAKMTETQNAMKALNLRDKSRLNDDGTESTVLMASAEVDGKFVAYPTLFPKNPNSYGRDPEWWMELDPNPAYDEALKRNEVFYFDTEQAAQEFAEGGWKDVNTVDAEADRFFKERGSDYTGFKKAYDEYEEAMETMDFLNRAPFREEDLTDEERAKYGNYYVDGKRRQDAYRDYNKLMAKTDELLPTIFDEDVRQVQQDFDLYMQKKVGEKAAEAAKTNLIAREKENEMQTESLKNFGMTLDELADYTPADEREAAKKERLLTGYKDAQAVRQIAGDKYEVAQTFFDAKFDKEVHQEWVDGWAATSNEWKKGYARGRAAEEVLKVALGITDLDDEASVEQVALAIIQNLQAAETGKAGRTSYDFHKARDFRETYAVVKNDPAKLAMEFVAQSISQMVPYGWKMMAIGAGSGAAIGAGIGATGFVTGPGGVLTTGGGTLAGLTYGARTAMASIMVALEYTNAVLDAAGKEYDVMDPNELTQALQDEEVWKEGRDIGLKRGLTIGAVDFLSSGLAGRLFKVGSIASRGARVGAQAAERLVVDPLAEGTGEYLAQVVAGQEVSGKEIFAEMWGGVGNNAPFAALNMALDSRTKNNVQLANNLANLNFMAREAASDEKISAWANKMEKLGQISAEQNQRIQENVGLRRDANELLELGAGKPYGIRSKEVRGRVMELMAAKEELSSTKNRQSVFAPKISEINAELAEIAETGKLRPETERTSFAATVSNLQAISGENDVRQGIKKYMINGRAYTKADFLSRLGEMNKRALMKAKFRVFNDEDTQDKLQNRLENALSVREAAQVDVGQQAGIGETVGERLSVGEDGTIQVEQVAEEATEPETKAIETTEPLALPPAVTTPTKKDKEAFEQDKLEGPRLLGILSGIADKQKEGKKLTPFQESVADKFKEQLDEVVSSKTLKEETGELSEMLGLPQGPTETTTEQEVVATFQGDVGSVGGTTIDDSITFVIEGTKENPRYVRKFRNPDGTEGTYEYSNEKGFRRAIKRLKDKGVAEKEVATTEAAPVAEETAPVAEETAPTQERTDVQIDLDNRIAETERQIQNLEERRETLRQSREEMLREDAEFDPEGMSANDNETRRVREKLEDLRDKLAAQKAKKESLERPAVEETTEEEAAPQTSVLQEDINRLENDIATYENEIETAQEEIAIEQGNTKEGIAEFKERIKGAKTKAQKEDLKAELQDFKDDQKDLIDSYKEDIKLLKKDLNTAKRGLKKLEQSRRPRVDFSMAESTDTRVDFSSQERVTEASEELQRLFRRDRMPLTVEEAAEILRFVDSWANWYDGISALIEAEFGEYAADYMVFLFSSAVASNSATTVSSSMNNLDRFYNDMEMGALANIKKNIYEYILTQSVGSRKINAFIKAGFGDVNAKPIDMHVHSLINSLPETKSPSTAKQFENAENFIDSVAEVLGWDPREVQAAMWAANMLRLNQKPDTYEQYIEKRLDTVNAYNNKTYRETIEGWRKAGIKPIFTIDRNGDIIELSAAQEIDIELYERKLQAVKEDIKRAAAKRKENAAKKKAGPKMRIREGDEVVYHGSPGPIEGGVLRSGISGAIFVTPNKQYAQGYMRAFFGDVTPELVSTTLTEEKRSKLFDLRNEEHVEQLKQGFINNNEDLEIEYESEADALRDYEQFVQLMRESASEEGYVNWATGSQVMEYMQNAGFEGAVFLERPKGVVDSGPVVSYALFDKEFAVGEDIRSEEQDMVNAMNEIQTEDALTPLSDIEGEVELDTDNLNSRTDVELPTLASLEIIDGIPVIFTISDQLTTGDVVNPNTGTTITNLHGGIGFNGTTNNTNAAWANTDSTTAEETLKKAQRVYEDNKALFDAWWEKNPEHNGLVPMVVAKMGENAILSNEAVFRVFRDNLSLLPEENRRKAVPVLIEAIKAERDGYQKKIDKGGLAETTVKGYKKTIKGFDNLISKIESANPTLIDDLLGMDFIGDMPLPAREKFLKLMTFGAAQRVGDRKALTKGQKRVGKTLLEGVEDKLELIHLGPITDLITDPSHANVPQRSAISIVGVDVLNPRTLDNVDHPNYKHGVAGRIIGVLEKPVAISEAFPVAYAKAMSKLIQEEQKTRVMTEGGREAALRAARREGLPEDMVPQVGEEIGASTDKILANSLVVQQGLPAKEFMGAVAQNDMTNTMKLTAFMNLTFPGVQISTDAETFNEVISRPDVRKYLKGNEVIYGVTVEGDVYINPLTHNSESEVFNTAIHEMGHVWTYYLQTTKKGRQLYAKGSELVKQTATYRRQLKRFDGDEKKAVNEAMAILIGNKGQSIADAAIKSKFKEWLLGMWKYIKTIFPKGSQDITANEIQDLTLDEFIAVGLNDIFSGKEIKLTDKQLAQMKDPPAAFSSTMSMDEIIDRGRANNFSDASIREVLKGQGYSKADIDAALEYKVDLNTSLPREFERVEGGVLRGAKLFEDVRTALNKYSTSVRGISLGRRIRTFADIRQKAMEFMKAHPIYQDQSEQVKMELLVGFDRALGYRHNPSVQREISAIRNNLRQRKVGAENLREAQIRLKNLIKLALPKSSTYSQAQINRLINTITKTNLDNFEAQTFKVLEIVEQQREKIRRQKLKDIYDIVKKKAKPVKTKSGKVRARGIDALGQEMFSAIKEVMDAVVVNDSDAIEKMNLFLQSRSAEVNEAMDKFQNGEDLTKAEQVLLSKQLAYDSFAELHTASLEEVMESLEEVKELKKEAILRYKTNRLERAARIQAMNDEVNSQLEETNPELFDEDGNVLDEQERADRRDDIYKRWRSMKIGQLVKNFRESLRVTKASKAIIAFKNWFRHLGTLTNLLDRINNGNTFFTDYIYRRLNRADETYNVGMYETELRLDNIARAAGFARGQKDVDMALHGLGTMQLEVIRSKTGRKRLSYMSGDQLLRIYALSKNRVQANKLNKMGITPDVVEDIATMLGPELTAYADGVVNFLSNEYYEGVNSVYAQVNNINLGQVENYFPTRTVRTRVSSQLLQDGDFNGVFNAETSPAFKERVDETSDIDLKGADFTGALRDHVQSMEKYKAFAQASQELNDLFRNEAVNALLEEANLKFAVKTAINFAINPMAGKNAQGLESGILETIQTKFTGFALSFKLIQILKQATSFVNAFEEYSYFAPNSRVPEAIQRPVDYVMFMLDASRVFGSLALDLVGKKGAIRQAMDMSATFRKRIEQGLEGDVYGLESGSQTFKPLTKGQSKAARARRAVRTAAASPTIIGDAMGVMGYMINYKRNIANGMSDAEALEAFNNYNATQQSRRGTDKIPLQYSNIALVRGFTMFGSSLFLMMNKAMSSGTNILRAKIYKARKQDIRAFYINLALSNVLFAVAANMMMFIKGDDEDREAAMKKIRDAMLGLNLLYQMPYLGAYLEKLDLGERLEAWYEDREYKKQRKLVDDVVNPFTSISYKVNRLLKQDAGMRAYVQPIIELALGTQLDPFIGLYNKGFGPSDIEEFDDNMYDLLGITPSYRPKNESKVGKIPPGGFYNKNGTLNKSALKGYDPELYDKVYGRKDEMAKRQKEKRKEILARMGYKEVRGKIVPID